MKDADHLFQRLCHEAVVACGTDMAAIERYMADKIDMMDPSERDRIRQDLKRLLAFQAPTRPSLAH